MAKPITVCLPEHCLVIPKLLQNARAADAACGAAWVYNNSIGLAQVVL